MKNKAIIIKFLTRQYSNNAHMLYIYVHGKLKSKELIINNILLITHEVFYPLLTDFEFKKIIIEFLEAKKIAILGGKIKTKSIY